MLLRDHALFRYRGIHSWPPVWTWTSGLNNTHPQGEIGIVRKVESRIQPANNCFLYIDHEGSSYIRCLLIENHVFCKQIVELLQS
jgi:hypothetical protein